MLLSRVCVYCVYVCIKTAKPMIMQTMPHDNPWTLVVWCQRSQQNPNGVTPNWGPKCRWSRL